MIGERSFFGKVLELIEKEAAGANPRQQAPDLVRDWWPCWQS